MSKPKIISYILLLSLALASCKKDDVKPINKPKGCNCVFVIDDREIIKILDGRTACEPISSVYQNISVECLGID